MKVLRYCKAIPLEHCIFGNCPSAGKGDHISYFKGLITFDNARWSDVPFIISCGDCVDDDVIQMTISFKKVRCGGNVSQNQLNISLRPGEPIAASLKVNLQSKGRHKSNHSNPKEQLIHLACGDGSKFDCGYESLLLDVLKASQAGFPRPDEIDARLRILRSLVCKETDDVCVSSYEVGSMGPSVAALPYLL